MRGQKIYNLSQGQISVCNLANVDQIIKGESESESKSGTFLFDWNAKFPVGKICGGFSSSYNISFVRDSGTTFSLGAIEMNSFSQDVFSKTASFVLDLYASRGFSRHSVFELLSKVLHLIQIPPSILKSTGFKISVVTLTLAL